MPGEWKNSGIYMPGVQTGSSFNTKLGPWASKTTWNSFDCNEKVTEINEQILILNFLVSTEFS